MAIDLLPSGTVDVSFLARDAAAEGAQKALLKVCCTPAQLDAAMALLQLEEEQVRTWTRAQKDEWWFRNVFRGDMPQLTIRSALTGLQLRIEELSFSKDPEVRAEAKQGPHIYGAGLALQLGRPDLLVEPREVARARGGFDLPTLGRQGVGTEGRAGRPP